MKYGSVLKYWSKHFGIHVKINETQALKILLFCLWQVCDGLILLRLKDLFMANWPDTSFLSLANWTELEQERGRVRERENKGDQEGKSDVIEDEGEQRSEGWCSMQGLID